MKNKFLRAITLCFIFLAMALNIGLVNGEVYAIDDNAPDFRLSITPTKYVFEEFKPGEIYTGKFRVVNDGKKEFSFKVSMTPYSMQDENYTPDYDKETKYTDLAKWVQLDKTEGSLSADGWMEINYTINIPEDAHGGAQMAVIMVTMDDVAEAGSFNATSRVGYVIYGNVDGEVIKTGKILENKIPSFLFTPPITATSVVENTGNVYTVAQYSLQVFPLFSDEEIYTNEETPEGNVVFPETKKLNTISWEGAPQLGIFKVRQTVKIFDEESVTEKLVFLCPLWFLFIVVLLVFCIIFWIVSRIIKRKKENY